MINKKGGRWMDLIKIGKYIASKRKSLGMTQKQLAEKLGMRSLFLNGSEGVHLDKDTTSIPRGLLLNRYSRRAG
jgi:transcriptional regulator with XRE-family HTH domain